MVLVSVFALRKACSFFLILGFYNPQQWAPKFLAVLDKEKKNKTKTPKQTKTSNDFLITA